MDVGTQIVNEHGTMVDILESRKIKLNAALTFWKKEDVTQLISYLLRTDDDSLFIDIIPFLAMGIREDNSIGKKITLGVVIELLPILQRLLKSKFEDYLVASLDFLRIMIQHWYMDLRDMKRKATNKEQSMSLPQVFMYLITLQERIKKLRRRDGKIGEKAKHNLTKYTICEMEVFDSTIFPVSKDALFFLKNYCASYHCKVQKNTQVVDDILEQLT